MSAMTSPNDEIVKGIDGIYSNVNATLKLVLSNVSWNKRKTW